MTRIVEYQILVDRDHTVLVKRVNEMLAKGFQPYGSLVCTYDVKDDKIYAFQPLVKFGDAPPSPPTPPTTISSKPPTTIKGA
jgi:hypothetical protein